MSGPYPEPYRTGAGTSPIGAILDLDFANARYSKTGVADTLANLVTTTRASGGYADDTSGNWTLFGVNVARRTNKGLSVEEARTNSIRNNSMQGLSPGSPGTLPTNWAQDPAPSGITQTIGAASTMNGVEGFTLTLAGSPAATSSMRVFTEGGTTNVAALTGQVWTNSNFLAITGGSNANLTIAPIVQELTSVGANVLSNTGSNVAGGLSASLTRPAYSPTLSGGGTTANVRCGLSFGFTAGQAVSITLFIGWPQLEQGAFTLSPERSTSVAVSRSLDVETSSLTGLTLPSVVTMVVIGRAASPATNAADQYFATLSDGTLTNRAGLIRAATTGNLGAVATPGAIANSAVPVAQDARFCAAMVFGANLRRISVNGGAAVSDTTAAAFPSGLAQLNIGNAGNGASSPANGYDERIILFPSDLTSSLTTLSSLATWGG